MSSYDEQGTPVLSHRIPDADTPAVSVIILNYNGLNWLERCLRSIQSQTLIHNVEIILADNASTDTSDKLAELLVKTLSNAHFLQHGQNLGYCEGNNRAVGLARGRYLLFLNNDTWLENDSLESLVSQTARLGAGASTPLVLNYGDQSFQSMGAFGFDIFGLPSTRKRCAQPCEVLMPEGCAYFIERDLFRALGGFDSEFFMFSDELDLSWRVWISGRKAVAIPSSRIHHRGAAQVNPKGGGDVLEFRTSDTKRFYANRNGLLVILINAQNVLLLLAVFQVFLLLAEALVSLVLVRRWSYVQRAYLGALADCWRLRKHILKRREQVRRLRQVGDWKMLRFLRLRFNRWDEIVRMWRFGMPRVSSR